MLSISVGLSTFLEAAFFRLGRFQLGLKSVDEDQKTEMLGVRKSGPLPVGSQQVEVQRALASKAIYLP